MEWLSSVGLGLDYNALRLDRTTQAWIDAGARLQNEVANQLDGGAIAVEHIGSSAVLNLLAKPIVDIAVGLHDDYEFSSASHRLEVAGWIYRGDAGQNGGHVFVLETKPQHRVAHLHIVEHDGKQWRDYMRLRDLLRRSSTARDQYEQAKQQLAKDVGDNRVAYTDGKSNIVSLLINEA